MRDVKRLNGLLWVVNAALVAAIGWFAVAHLLKEHRYLRDFQPDPGGDSAPVARAALSDASLKISNPVENRIVAAAGPVVHDFKAKLQGVLPGDKTGVAFLRATARNVEVVAYLDEAIFHEGKEFDEFRGWTLTKVMKDRATFTGPGGKTAELSLDLSSPGPEGAPAGPSRPGARGARTNRAGQAYSPDQFKSRLLASSENRQVWGVDPDEVDWAAQNAEKIMDSDFQVSPNAGGGVRLENVNPGTMAASRGLMGGDVVRDVNGQPLNNIQDLRSLLNNPGFRQQTGMRITVERGGRPVVLEYRPLPR